MASVKLVNIRKVYENGFEAVKDASFEIRDGEFVVLVGPSGCGKSTTLRMVAGLETISGGEIYIGDRKVNDVPPKDRDIAMVFQNYALYPHMTVYDNMAFGLKLRKFARADIEARVQQAARILGIEAILDRKPKQLSGGQRQRVAVGRAIVRKPEVFLFDEPLSNLDAKLRVQMRTEISNLHRTLGATMIYVTHDQVEAMTMGDRIVVLRDGEIQQIDTPLNLYHAPVNRFVAGFIGSPSMNFVPGSLRAAAEGEDVAVWFVNEELGVNLPIESVDASVLAGRETVDGFELGIRPEDIYLEGSPYSVGRTYAIAPRVLEVVEPMGNEIVVYTGLSGIPLVSRLAPQAVPDVGAAVTLAVDASRAHVFERETGLRVGRSAAPVLQA